jgi:hypothetical protein
MAEKKIMLAIGKDEIEFNVTTEEFNRYVNEITPSDKVSPSRRLLRRTIVNPEQKELLDTFCDRGLTVQMATKLIGEFQGEVEIEVKK